MSNVTTTLSVAMSPGQTVSVSSGVFEADASDTVAVEVPNDDTFVVANLQPGAASELRALLVYSSYYGPHLVYQFSDGTDDATGEMILDGPQMFSAGNIRATVDPTKIKLKMAVAGETATVNILVVRDATPTP